MASTMHEVTDANVMGDINVTPMVDVMLVLLIIFMVMMPVIVTGFPAKLPEGVHLRSRPEEERSVLGLDRFGAYHLNARPIPGCAAEHIGTSAGLAECDATLRRLLSREFAAHPRDRVLFVKADRSLRYAAILHAMDVARQSGARVMAAVTEQRPGTRGAAKKPE